MIAGGWKEPHICAWRPSHRRKSGKRNKPHLYQVEVGGQRGPGARPLVRDVGCSLGHSPCLPLNQRKGPRLGISPAGSTSYDRGRRPQAEGTTDTNNQHAHPSTNNLLLQPRCKSSSSELGECSQAPSALPPSLSPGPKQQGPLGGDGIFPRMKLVTGTHVPEA